MKQKRSFSLCGIPLRNNTKSNFKVDEKCSKMSLESNKVVLKKAMENSVSKSASDAIKSLKESQVSLTARLNSSTIRSMGPSKANIKPEVPPRNFLTPTSSKVCSFNRDNSVNMGSKIENINGNGTWR